MGSIIRWKPTKVYISIIILACSMALIISIGSYVLSCANYNTADVGSVFTPLFLLIVFATILLGILTYLAGFPWVILIGEPKYPSENAWRWMIAELPRAASSVLLTVAIIQLCRLISAHSFKFASLKRDPEAKITIAVIAFSSALVSYYLFN